MDVGYGVEGSWDRVGGVSVLMGLWSGVNEPPKYGDYMTERCVRDDVETRVLVVLRERHEDLLDPSALFGLSGMGLLVGVWSELSWNGE